MPNFTIKKLYWTIAVVAALAIATIVFQPIVGQTQPIFPPPPPIPRSEAQPPATQPANTTAPPTNAAQPPTAQQLAAQQKEKDITKTAGGDAKCNAGWITCAIMEAFQWITLYVSYVIGFVAGFFISFAAAAIQILVNASAKITSNPLVTEGFKITLDVANLGFVLAIIVIAYTTIFRISGYETKKLLKNLIIAALLVNFSFTIAGAIIDFSNVFGNFFLNAITPAETGKFADNLANSLNVHKLANITPAKTDNIFGAMEKFGAGYLGIFTSIAATVIFSVVLVITFFAVAVMLLIRYIYLIILLILMPIAWLMWIFPGFSKHWSAWWSKFIQWNLFYPAVMFFIYLAVLSSQKVGEVVNQNSVGASALKGASTLANVSTDIIVGFLQIFVQVGILFGGLIAANKLGIDGSAGALKMASGFKNWAIGATGKAVYKATGAQMFTNRMLRKGGVAETTAGFLSKTPVLRNLPFAQTAAAGLYNLAATRQKAVGKEQENFSKDSEGALLAKFNQFTTDKVRKAALVNEVVKRGFTDKVDQKRLESYLGDAKDMEATKDILENAPQLAPRVADRAKLAEEIKKAKPDLAGLALETEIDRKSIQAAMDKFRPSNTEKLPVSAFKDINVIIGLRKPHLERLAKEGTEEQRREIARTARRELPDNDPNRAFLEANPMMQSALETIEKEEVGKIRVHLEEKIKEEKIKKEEEKPPAP